MKKIVSIGLSVALIGSLIGCAPQLEKKTVETTSQAIEEQKEIVLWYTNEELKDYMEQAASEYSKNTNTLVDIKLVSAIDYIENINQAVLKDEAAPDLFVSENSNVEQIYLAGLSSENTDEILSENNYYKTALNAFTYKEKQLAYPMYFETSYLLYNAKYVSNAPQTIDDILNFSYEFDAPEGVESVFNWDVTDLLSNYFFIGNYLNCNALNQEDYIKDQEKLKEAFGYYQNLNQYFAIDAQTVDYETAFQNFIDGKSVFTIAKTDKLSEIEMIEGDANEKTKDDTDSSTQKVNASNEKELKEKSNEAKEEETSKEENEETSTQGNEETSKDSEKDNQSTAKESSQAQEGSNGLSKHSAGIEQVLSQTQVKAKIKEFDSKYKIASLPNLTSELEGKGLSVNYGVFVNGYTTKEEDARAFARYLTYEKAPQLYKKAGKLSARSELDYQNENIDAVLEQYQKTTSVPQVMENGDYWLKLEIIFSNIWKGADVEQTMQEITQ